MKMHRRRLLSITSGLFAAGWGAHAAVAQSPVPGAPSGWSHPVHRVANAAMPSQSAEAIGNLSPGKVALKRGLEMARASLEVSRGSVNDYTALLVKRERIGEKTGEHEYMSLKVRNRKMVGGQLVQPFSVYIAFLKPSSVKGREVIYVENRNNGKLVAHEGGMSGRFLPTVSLPVDGMLAMRGQRYPLTEIGVEKMIVKLIERGTLALQHEDVECQFRKGAKLKDRVCTVLDVTQPTRTPDALFYQAQVFMDDELNLPIRYVAYDWPTLDGQPGSVIEEYNYLNLKTNVGLTDADFDPYNKAYGFH